MFEMAIPIGEMIVRAFVVYTFLLVALRLTGKRQISESSPFDFVLLLIVADGVQNSMSGGDESLQGGLHPPGTSEARGSGKQWVHHSHKKRGQIKSPV
nr:hypothetical protein [Bdellovibrio sp. ArHS]